MTKDEAKLVVDELRDALDTTSDKHRRQRLDRCVLIMRREVEPISDAEISKIWRDLVGSGDPSANNNFHLRFSRALLEKAR